MSRGRLALLTVAVAGGVVLSGCSGDPKNVTILLDAPLQVKVGEKFQIKAHVTNTGPKAQKLVSLDVGEAYRTGIAIEKSNPSFSQASHIPIDNTMSYEFNLDLPSNQEKVVTFYATALKAGDYSSKVDFCINSSTSFLSYPVRTFVSESGPAPAARQR